MFHPDDEGLPAVKRMAVGLERMAVGVGWAAREGRSRGDTADVQEAPIAHEAAPTPTAGVAPAPKAEPEVEQAAGLGALASLAEAYADVDE